MSINSSPPPQFITQPPARGVKRSPSPEPDTNGNIPGQLPTAVNGTGDAYVPKLMYTSFPIKGFPILPTRNITSSYLRSEASYFPGEKPGSEKIVPDPEQEGSDVIIIHPGSRHLRIGRASEAFPRTVPHVIARKMNSPVELPKSRPLAVRITSVGVVGARVAKKDKDKGDDMDLDENGSDDSESENE
ncbi:hypothetical protein BC936DRAFT_142554, partial [Jimgerdemannia flammicorona]